MDENEAQVKEHLTRLIKNLAGNLPSPAQATADLWKFAKMHDRRSYQLIRFCMAPESDYRTVFKANVGLGFLSSLASVIAHPEVERVHQAYSRGHIVYDSLDQLAWNIESSSLSSQPYCLQ